MQLRDKRVDRMLQEKGYTDAVIFYGPISIWLTLFAGYILAPALAILFFVVGIWLLLLLPYLLAAYLVNARHSCSFALSEGKCIVINPNPPFRKFVTIDLEDIVSVEIGESRKKWPVLFTLFGDNYVEIKTGKETRRFYCAYLEQDAFDENFTEKTIEDFQYALEQCGIPVSIDLES